MRTSILITIIAAFTFSAVAADNDKIAIKEGQKLVFMGDSITQSGNRPGGYVQLVVTALNQRGLKIDYLGKGVSGHKSDQMLRRLDGDVINQKPKPDWMTLSCGVNDVWHRKDGKGGVALPDYKKNMTEIVDKCQAAEIKVMILTATVIHEQQENKLNTALAPYNEFLRQLAKEKNCLLADLNQLMWDTLEKMPAEQKGDRGRALTTDGVHMNAAGNKLMAQGVLKAFGFTEEDLAKAEVDWKTDTNRVRMPVGFSISLNEQEKFREKGINIGRLLQDYLKKNREKIIEEILEENTK